MFDFYYFIITTVATDFPGGATLSNKMNNLARYRHVQYTLTDLDVCKKSGSFLDIGENAQ